MGAIGPYQPAKTQLLPADDLVDSISTTHAPEALNVPASLLSQTVSAAAGSQVTGR